MVLLLELRCNTSSLNKSELSFGQGARRTMGLWSDKSRVISTSWYKYSVRLCLTVEVCLSCGGGGVLDPKPTKGSATTGPR